MRRLGTLPLILCLACAGNDDDEGIGEAGSTTGAPKGSSDDSTTLASADGDGSTAGTGSSTDTTAPSEATDTSGTTASDDDADTTSDGVEPPACDFFFDDFSLGDTSFSDNGFTWQNQSFPVSEGFGHGDDHALLFSFGPDAPGEDSTSELRFQLGREVQQLWIELWIYVSARPGPC